KLNVTAPAPSEQDKFEGKVYFFDIMTRDPKDFPKIFSNHGTQVLYHNILNPFNTSLSRQQVFNSLTYQWNDINYVPLLYRRCEKEIYGDTGV
ncbi:hypothetical protein, partial [Escherichia coli]|uniref:hypothetical protein n=1 Tax=Escherichia coli TaxID=562 RepID=UPI001980C009